MRLPPNQRVFTRKIKEVVRSILEQVECKQRTEEEQLWI